MLAASSEERWLSELTRKMENANQTDMSDTKYVEPLFRSEEEYQRFRSRHEKAKIRRKRIEKVSGRTYLGIDAGSTTTKATLVDDNKNLLYSFYRNNEGDPAEAVRAMLKELYSVLPDTAYIANTMMGAM
jgi:activator of 2-hydroxyglutaryl-CoA dehydratase